LWQIAKGTDNCTIIFRNTVALEKMMRLQEDTSDALAHHVLSINSHCDFSCARRAWKNHVLIEEVT
jgi:hypothetical protein